MKVRASVKKISPDDQLVRRKGPTPCHQQEET
jgi:ribosomal protein L36